MGHEFSSRAVKRLLDIAMAGAGLVVASPALLIVAAAVLRKMGRPVLFRQVRLGLGERTFRVLKFRTMTDARGPDGRLLPDEQRSTALGRFLREHSLDELPQLWNVLRGEMSLVGPRPLPMRYLPRYSKRQRARHQVKPGITGLAQVTGRNDLDWESRFKLDVWYVEHWSVWLDLKILGATFIQVFRKSGVRAGGGAEVEEFWGEQTPHPDAPKSIPMDEDEFSAIATPGAAGIPNGTADDDGDGKEPRTTL